MGFSFFRSALILTIMLVLIAAPACAITVTVGTRDGLESASASGEYRLQNSAFLDSDITLGQGEVSRRSSAGGTGKNMVHEEVSGNGGSVTNTITSDGSFRSTSSDFASGAGAISSYQTSLAGLSGSIGTTSTGKENQMTVAGGFSGEGDMDVSLSSLAAQEALTTGTASALGAPVFSDELVQGIRGQDMGVSVHGLYLAGEKGLGEFGMFAQNAKGGAAAKPQPSPADYKLLGYKWQSRGMGPQISIALSEDGALPNGLEGSVWSDVYDQISSAEVTWDTTSSKKLFSTLGITTGGTPLDSNDGKNVHLWTSDTGIIPKDKDGNDNIIAMTNDWYIPVTKTLVESDCWYNNRLNWRIDEDGIGGSGNNNFDIRTIALHELGHTLGLADLYENSNTEQTMYGYNDGKADWTLNSGDIAGVQKLYGK